MLADPVLIWTLPEDINKLTLENKMKQLKIKTQDEKITDMYGKLREQATLLEETKLKLQSISLLQLSITNL